MLAQKKIPDGQKEEISQVGILSAINDSKCYLLIYPFV